MKEIPILFSTPMVQAILAFLKTMTRRLKGLDVLNKWPSSWVHDNTKMYVDNKGRLILNFWNSNDGRRVEIPCPYGKPGDVLWVRENFKVQEVQRYFDAEWRNNVCIDFPASEGTLHCRHWFKIDEKQKPKVIQRRHPDRIFTSPSIHLPMMCARIWLEVTHISVERLQDISEEDAISEGVLRSKEVHSKFGRTLYYDYTADQTRTVQWIDNPIESFTTLWIKINGFDSWEANPWVWVVSFKVLSTTGKPELKIASAIP